MPSSSRKKNKGKERKAKKEAEEAESKRVTMYNYWSNWASGIGSTCNIVQCNHGFDTTIPDISHPVSSFFTEYFLSNDVRDTLQRHIEAFNDSDRKLAIDMLTLIGANLILHKSTADFVTVKEAAFAIMLLEKYGKFDDFYSLLNSRDITTKIGNLNIHKKNTNNNRDMLKFFRKRMNCKCLKKMHLEARKTQQKLGVCFHCNQMKERDLLMVCSRCRVDQYCSRKCQVAASAKHRVHCDRHVEAHQQTMANDSSLSNEQFEG